MQRRTFVGGAGSKVLALEKEFAARMGTKYALGVTSGTAALQVAMAALEIGPGWTWHSCFNAVVPAGSCRGIRAGSTRCWRSHESTSCG